MSRARWRSLSFESCESLRCVWHSSVADAPPPAQGDGQRRRQRRRQQPSLRGEEALLLLGSTKGAATNAQLDKRFPAAGFRQQRSRSRRQTEAPEKPDARQQRQRKSAVQTAPVDDGLETAATWRGHEPGALARENGTGWLAVRDAAHRLYNLEVEKAAKPSTGWAKS